MTTLAIGSLELHLRGRVRFGVDAVATLAELVRDVGAERAFVVTDPGVMGSGVAARVVGALEDVGIGTALFDEVEANRARRRSHGIGRPGLIRLDGTVVIPVGGGSSMDSAKVMALHAANGGRCWPSATTATTSLPASGHRDPDDRGHRRGDQHLRGHHRRGGGAQGLRRASVRAAALADCSTGTDRRCAARRHRRDRRRRAGPLARKRCHGTPTRSPRRSRWGSSGPSRVAAPGVRGRLGHRGALAGLPDGLAPRGDRSAERDRRRAGPRARPRDRDAGRLPHGLALAIVGPEVLAFYAAQRVAGPRAAPRRRRPRRVPTETPETGAVAAIGALRGFLAGEARPAAVVVVTRVR